MKKGILKSIFRGALNGFPLLQSIIKNVKGVKETPVTNADGTIITPPKQFDIVAILTEACIVALIVGFVTGKVTIENLEKLIGLLKP